MNQNVEIICVGNELLIGKTLNTNAQWLSNQLTKFGFIVRRITVVSDDVSEIANSVREALQRKNQIIITTGGLGPTFDDKTLEGLAKAVNSRLAVNAKALKMVKKKYEEYARINRAETPELTKSRIKMATLPEKAEPITNPIGTAPGIRMELGETTLIALPGVPSEMEAIFHEVLKTFPKRKMDEEIFHERSIFADAIMESSLAPLIVEVMNANPSIYIKSHPKGVEHESHIEIHLSTRAGKMEKAIEKLDKAANELSAKIECFGGRVTYQ